METTDNNKPTKRELNEWGGRFVGLDIQEDCGELFYCEEFAKGGFNYFNWWPCDDRNQAQLIVEKAIGQTGQGFIISILSILGIPYLKAANGFDKVNIDYLDSLLRATPCQLVEAAKKAVERDINDE